MYRQRRIPCDKKCGIRDNFGPNSYLYPRLECDRAAQILPTHVSLLDEFVGRADSFRLQSTSAYNSSSQHPKLFPHTIRNLVITTPSRRRQKADTVILRSTSESFPVPLPPTPSSPISCSFSSSRSSCFRLKGESGGRRATRWARCLSLPHNRL